MLLRLPDPASRARAHRGGPAQHPPVDRPEAERALAVQFVRAFEGWSLVTIACNHRPYWLLIELAAVLGVERPDQLLATLSGPWRDRQAHPAVVSLEGGERREVLEKLERAHVVLPPSTRRRPLVVVDANAVEELCARFDSALARRLRHHLRHQVIPEFHAWERGTRALEQPILSVDAATIAGNRLEFERRCFEAAVLERLLDRLDEAGMINGDLLAAHRVVASEIALGGWLEDYQELLAHGWFTPTQIAERWCGMTPLRVGTIIAHLGLKGSRAHSRAFLDKARGSDRTVICHIYSPAAVGLIERELRSRGYVRCEELDLIEPGET